MHTRSASVTGIIFLGTHSGHMQPIGGSRHGRLRVPYFSSLNLLFSQISSETREKENAFLSESAVSMQEQGYLE